MTFSKIGRMVTALVASAALGLGMTACGGGTIGYMWVVGTYYNQISGFLIDDYTGNLTAIAHTPFASGGSNPNMIVVKPGGRFVYVVNSGTGATGTPGTSSFNSPGAAISEFSVGSGGILTFQQNYLSQGVHPVWAAIDSSGNYLYVLDKYSPDYATTGHGVDHCVLHRERHGRLTLVTNATILTQRSSADMVRCRSKSDYGEVRAGRLSLHAVAEFDLSLCAKRQQRPAYGADDWAVPGGSDRTGCPRSTRAELADTST